MMAPVQFPATQGPHFQEYGFNWSPSDSSSSETSRYSYRNSNSKIG